MLLPITIRVGMILLLLSIAGVSFSQGSQTANKGVANSLDSAVALPDRLLGKLSARASSFDLRLQRKTSAYLRKLQKEEGRLHRKLIRRDSSLRSLLVSQPSLQLPDSLVAASVSSPYSATLDSLQTSLRLLAQSGTAAQQVKAKALLAQYTGLQTRFSASALLQQQLDARRAFLRGQCERLGMVRELRRYQKEVYYYKAQVAEYRALLSDPDKAVRKLLALAQKLPQFQAFFARHSQLASLFGSPPAPGGGTGVASLAGLQTRASVQAGLVDRFGSLQAVQERLTQGMGQAGAQLQSLKSKAQSLQSGSVGNGNADLPQNFKPNGQKTKSFWKRLEWGGNVQTVKARYFFPVTSDLGLSVGYKLNDKAVVGVGGSYKMGWGRGWDNLKITHQGIAVRSYMDWKLKGSFYLAGGYEQNYRSEIQNIDQLKDRSAWQTSGLLGLSKRYSAGKRLRGDVKLMWDFLSYRQVPRTEAVVFRIGYALQ